MAQSIRDDGGAGDLWLPNPEFLPDPNDIHLTTVTLENPYLHSEVDNLDVNLEYELGFATLRSITGYARSEVRNVDDCAARFPEMAGCVRAALPNETEQWSQELQLVIPGSRGISGIVGVYYADSDGELGFMIIRPLELPRRCAKTPTQLSAIRQPPSSARRLRAFRIAGAPRPACG